jgi:MFS family permease
MRTFFTLWLGQLISLTGSQLTGFALGVWVFQQTGSVTHFALISLFAVLPHILISPLAGPLSDRVFEPLLATGGPLTGSVGQLIGSGPGRGIGLLFLLMGSLTILTAVAGFLQPRLRRVELELPDALGLNDVLEAEVTQKAQRAEPLLERRPNLTPN